MSTMYERACAGRSRLGWLWAAAACLLMAELPAMAADTLPSETPANFVPRVDSFDYVKREVMIPIREVRIARRYCLRGPPTVRRNASPRTAVRTCPR
jgi:hypothetical protein